MIPTIDITLEYILADTAHAQLTLSEASKKLNEAQSVYKSNIFRTVGDMEDGKFRRMFNRHRTAYKLFN